MRIGPLRHRVTLQSQSTTQSNTGAVTRVWTDVATVWASVEPNTGKERYSAGKLQSEVDTRIVIRYSTDVASIDSSWRVKWGARYYDILAAMNHQERDIMISLLCKEGPTDD